MRDPYLRAGLRANPFVADQKPGVPDGLWVDRGLPDRLEFRARTLVQVLGPKGAGKTSHLLRWRSGLPGPYVHVRPGAGRLRRLPVSQVSYWDEADRAVWLSAGLMVQSAFGHMVVAGTHRDLTPWAALVGLDVETWTVPPLTEDAVAAFAAQRFAAVGGDANAWNLPRRQIAAAAGSSLREAARLLHIETARQVGLSVSRR